MWKQPVDHQPVTASLRQRMVRVFAKATNATDGCHIDPRNMEECLFVSHEQYGIDYRAKAEWLLWNINNNSDVLRRHTASSIWATSDEDLRGEATSEWYQQMRKNKEAEERILTYVKIYDKAELEKSSGALVCPKCWHNDIATTQQQTRGADEAITTFLFCLNCSARWRM